jgi:hypothetical protein
MHAGICAAAICLLLAPRIALTAQGLDPSFVAEQQRLKHAKLTRQVFARAEWLVDYDVARKQAKESRRLILTYFTRSFVA